MQGLFQSLLGDVDARTSRRFFGRRQLSQPFQKVCQRTILAKVTGFGLFQRIGIINAGE
jgi:hypothetical protein